MLCVFLLQSKVNQLFIHIDPLFFGFLSHLGHHRVLSRVPCAIQQVILSYLFYTQLCIYVEQETAAQSSILAQRIPWTEEAGGLQCMGSQGVGHSRATEQQQCVYVNPHLPIHSSLPSRLVSIICPVCLCLYFSFANKII